MASENLLKSKKFQIGAIIALITATILFSLLTDFPEGDTQGALRNKRFGPATQPQSTQTQQQINPQQINNQQINNQQINPQQINNQQINPQQINNQPTTQGYDVPENDN